MTASFAPAYPHGSIEEVFGGIYFVTGTSKMPGAMRFSRNMTVVREDGRLIIINSVRLDDAGLQELDALGKVTDVVRLAGFHGIDDPFYQQRYAAKLWAVDGQRWVKGFDYRDQAIPTYLNADARLGIDGLPLRDASLYTFDSSPPEAMLLLHRFGGICIAGDALQNWSAPDAYFSLMGKVVMKLMGFLKAHNVGPGWLKQAKPSAASLKGALALDFEHVLPAHGAPVRGQAKRLYEAALQAAAAGARQA
ncbi:MAG: hypothetical protein IT381_04150 [Deltaproteobacteria bacterium]|nr:hypothetical protein [Deltaproteobacteria bacterium]